MHNQKKADRNFDIDPMGLPHKSVNTAIGEVT